MSVKGTLSTHAPFILCCYLTSLSNLPLALSPPSLVPRCSWQYTSVTMTSILLRSPLPRRHCAGTWWSCARSRERPTATCLRFGVDLVSDGASSPSVTLTHLHTMKNRRFSVTCCFGCGILWMYPKGRESVCRHLFVFFLLIRGKLLFWSRPYMEISCVVNCSVISFWRAYLFLGLQCKWSRAHNPCNKQRHSDISHISQVGGGGGRDFMPSPFSPSLRIRRYSESKLKEPGFVAVSMVTLP